VCVREDVEGVGSYECVEGSFIVGVPAVVVNVKDGQ
jgi:hypothetical protein